MSKAKKSSKAQRKAEKVVETYVGEGEIKTDPMGSWTGKPSDAGEIPIQDVDDL